MGAKRGAACVSVFLILALPVCGASEVPPVLLYTGPPFAPEEAAGTEIAPQVTVKLHFDARGRPANIEIVRIHPSTQYDDAFVREVKDALHGWRAAPALRDGVAVPSMVQWTIEFSAVAARSETVEIMTQGPLRAGAPKDPWDRWIEHLARLSREQRQKLLKTARRVGEGLLQGSEPQQATSDHFQVITDAPLPGTSAVVAGNLEGTYGAAFRIFANKVTPEIAGERVLVFFYRSEGSFRSFAASREVPLQEAAGFYDSLGILSFHMEMEANEILRQVLLHEGVHAFLNQHVVRPGVRLPLWLEEGLAQYVGYSDVRDGRIVLGSLKSSTVYHNPVASIRTRSLPRVAADEVQTAFRKGRAIPLGELVAARGDRFYGEKARMFYTQSWMFVHFLRHGRPGWEATEFPRFVLYVAEGFAPSDAFRGVYGKPPDEVSQEFGEYIARF